MRSTLYGISTENNTITLRLTSSTEMSATTNKPANLNVDNN